MNMVNLNVTRKLDNPDGSDKKVERKAVVSLPQVGAYAKNDKGRDIGEVLPGTVSVDDIINTFGSWERVADLLNDAVIAKARIIAFNELGKGDEATKNFNKALQALKAMPGLSNVPEDSLRAMLMTNPEVKASMENVNLDPVISLTVDIERIFTDGRKKDEEKTSEESSDSTEASESTAA